MIQHSIFTLEYPDLDMFDSVLNGDNNINIDNGDYALSAGDGTIAAVQYSHCLCHIYSGESEGGYYDGLGQRH